MPTDIDIIDRKSTFQDGGFQTGKGRAEHDFVIGLFLLMKTVFADNDKVATAEIANIWGK